MRARHDSLARIACVTVPVSAPIESRLPIAWRFPAAVRVVAVVFVVGVVLFAGDADVSWEEFRWNLVVGAVAGVAIALLLFRPGVRVEVNGDVIVRNPVTTHRFACSDVVSTDLAWLGHLSVQLADGQRVALWAVPNTRQPAEFSNSPSFVDAVEFFRQRGNDAA